MDWQSIGKTVATVAPILGSVLGGPVGAIAGAAGGLLGSFLGVGSDPAEIATALKNPDTMLRLIELEARQQEVLIGWQNAQLQAELANIQGAREREVRLAEAGHKGAWGTSVVAIIVTVGFFGMMYLVLSGETEGKRYSEVLVMLLGTLGASFGAVVNYYLGSSLGSARKQEQFDTAKR